MTAPTEEQRKRFYNLTDDAWFVGAEALRKFGTEEQIQRALEELAELQVAILHWERGHDTTDRADVASEVADVIIVALQMAMCVGVDETIEALGRKTTRLGELLGRVEP